MKLLLPLLMTTSLAALAHLCYRPGARPWNVSAFIGLSSAWVD